jgi:deoxyribonucleoside regulator
MYKKGLMIKVAEMYYYRKLSQKNIAEMLGISVPTVSRILNDALAAGNIKVEIVDKERATAVVAGKMKKKFGLRAAVVVPSPASTNDGYLKKILGKAACSTFLDLIGPGNLIGVGPGETIMELVESMDPGRLFPGITLLPLMGGWGYGGVAYEVNKLLGTAASALHCDFNLMPCPALVSSEKVRQIFFAEPLIIETVKRWDKVDVAVFSIGGEVEAGNYPQLRGNQSLVTMAKEAGAVGDVLGRFIGTDGRDLDLDVNRRIVSISGESFMKVPLRIGIGGGSAKIRAIRAALGGGLIHVLVSDESTCETILKMEDEEDGRKHFDS